MLLYSIEAENFLAPESGAGDFTSSGSGCGIRKFYG